MTLAESYYAVANDLLRQSQWLKNTADQLLAAADRMSELDMKATADRADNKDAP